MATKITDAQMTSDETRHTATADGRYSSWSVSWLPGRVLTYSQAITAMTIAEVAASHDFLPVGDAPGDVDPVWLFIDGWAAELGISGPHAVAEASLSPEDHAAAPHAAAGAPLSPESVREVAEAGVLAWGPEAAAWFRGMAAQAAAEGSATRGSWLRFAEEAERLLAAGGKHARLRLVHGMKASER